MYYILFVILGLFLLLGIVLARYEGRKSKRDRIKRLEMKRRVYKACNRKY